ncbi:MAG: hypothetical protein RL065_118 [Bacteroidota bacterium]
MLFPWFANAQFKSNYHSKKIINKGINIKIDSLPIVEKSVLIFNNKHQILNDSLFKIDFIHSNIQFSKRCNLDTFNISYRCINFKLDSIYFHKNPAYQIPLHGFIINPFEYKPDENLKTILDFGSGLNYAGSYTRGLSFGNAQSLVTNSSFNLQLSGKIANDVNITAAMTDNNIPIQPEGNTAQIQDFDKIFIKMQRRNLSMVAGDFDFQRPNSYFLNAYKKLQGIQVQSIDTFGFDENSPHPLPLERAGVRSAKRKNFHQSINSVTFAGAIARGKYARNQIQGIEGNQGPYRLQGANGETFIIILAGSEKVYLDGVLLKRGAEYDYTIDYNLGELIFTANRLITKDKRIQIEFQYSDKNYLRTTIFAADEWKYKNVTLRMNLYNESDAANQPQEPFKKNEKNILSSVGDSIQQAFIGSSTLADYDVNKILYRKIDTLINGKKDSIFVFSANKDSSLYTVSFTNVGSGNGDYSQLKAAANGRVYTYVGKLKGNYLPVVKIIAPNKQTVITAALSYQTEFQKVNFEAAVSQYDPNSLSVINNNTHTGAALKMNAEQHFNLLKLKQQTNVSYEFVESRFKPVENFRTLEFNRDWSVNNSILKYNQHIFSAGANLKISKSAMLQYNAQALLVDSLYSGIKHYSKLYFEKNNFHFDAGGSVLNFENINTKGNFIRPEAHLSKVISKKIDWKTGLNWNREQNIQHQNDTLTHSSFWFDNVELFATNADTSKNKISLNANRRWDNLALNNAFHQVSKADAASLNFETNTNENSKLTVVASYRNLTISDTLLTKQRNENTMLGRTTYFLKVFDGLINFETLYEVGNVQEPKREYTFLKVPDGTGKFAWNDLNADGIQQLNEFTENDFQNKLSYNRILTPTSNYVKANQVQWNQSINIEPANFWAEKYGAKKWMNRLILQSNLQITKKSLTAAGFKSYEPISSIADSLKVSELQLFNSTLFVNRNRPGWGIDVGWLSNLQKQLLNYGFETRLKKEFTFHTRLSISSKLNNTNTFQIGNKGNSAQYVYNQTFKLKYYFIEPKINLYLNKDFRVSMAASFKSILNIEVQPKDSALVKKITTELKWNVLNSSVVNASFSLAAVEYNHATNTPVAYAMLEGLQKGSNYLWSVSIERKLANNIEMSIIYDGRKTGTANIVHTGRASIRALF